MLKKNIIYNIVCSFVNNEQIRNSQFKFSVIESQYNKLALIACFTIF